jgi:hypothetical protein
MSDCPTTNLPARLCALEEQMAEVLLSVGHPPAHLTFGAGPNSWDDATQVGNINVPVIPTIPDPEVVVVADNAARLALAPTKLNQLLIQTVDATNLGYSIWAATGLAAGNWTIKTSSMAMQQQSNVTITGGSISGISDLAVADGGTGASNGPNARVNLRNASQAPAALDINWSLSDNFYETINANTAFTFSNMQDGLSNMVAVASTGAYTVSWPAAVKWPTGVVPVHSGAGKTDVYAFVRINGVTYGSIVQDYVT